MAAALYLCKVWRWRGSIRIPAIVNWRYRRVTQSEVEVRRATVEDLEFVFPLFDAYRQFYRQPSDLEGARGYLRERLERKESIVFLAFVGGSAVGFTQLYPSFSSGAMRRILILNDLFVLPEARGQGMGSALLDAAAGQGRRDGAIRLTVSTEINNAVAQSVYERNGWRRDAEFSVYHLRL